MRSRLLIILLGLAFFLLLTSCAQTHLTLRLTEAGPGASRVWPAPPERPRYRYVGQLTGEENFHSENEAARSIAVKVFDWLVGLVGGDAKRVVLQRPQTGTVDAAGRVYVKIGRASCRERV